MHVPAAELRWRSWGACFFRRGVRAPIKQEAVEHTEDQPKTAAMPQVRQTQNSHARAYCTDTTESAKSALGLQYRCKQPKPSAGHIRRNYAPSVDIRIHQSLFECSGALLPSRSSQCGFTILVLVVIPRRTGRQRTALSFVGCRRNV